jgi:hypothetical protein
MNLQLAINPASTSLDDFLIGRIEFTTEERAGQLPASTDVTGTLCVSPGCDCGEICLHFPPLDPNAPRNLEPGEPPLPRFIVLSTEFQEAQPEFVELDEPTLQAVGRELPGLMTEEHWEAAGKLYKDARTRLAETCDIASFDRLPECLLEIANNPDAKDAEASLRDLFSFPFDTGEIDGSKWFLEEFYPVPNTPTPLWVTVEFRVTEDGLEPNLTDAQYEELLDAPDDSPEHSCPTLSLRWNLDTGEVKEVLRIKTDLPIERFLDLLLKVHPDARERFRRRHQHLVQSIARIPAWLEANPDAIDDDDDIDPAWLDDVELSDPANLKEPSAPAQPTVRDTPKVGRNDPCPCGSGKKFKKCCGG